MNSSDDDKLRNGKRQPPSGERANSASADVTRHKKVDATRVAPKPAASDKTKIKKKPPTEKRPDVTQFKPAVKKESPNPNATRVASDKTRVGSSASSPSGQVSPPAAQTASDVRVLKERFILERVLGVGGMGVVYKAKDLLKVEAKDRDPYVAIKVLSEEFKKHPEAFISLQRESRKSQRIAHPNTVKVYDFDRDGDTVFMTMEYMDGRPLDQMISQYKSTGLPRDDVWSILQGMCSALVHAHGEKIVHSDFKPGNVFVTGDGMAKIFDFGIARAVAQVDRLDGKAMDKTVFDAGNLGALTPAYASLEMLQGQVPDVRDDIYALGCTAYEMFTGEHPFNKLPADEAYRKNLKPKRIAGIKSAQWKAIEKALAFKREDRVASVEEFYDQISLKYRRSYKWIAVAALVLASVFLTYFFTFKQQPLGLSENDIRNELEFKIRYGLHKDEIEKLLAKPLFTNIWEEDLWDEVSGINELLGDIEDDWLDSTRQKIFVMYINKIRSSRKSGEFDRSRELIVNAKHYSEEHDLLDEEMIKLAQAMKNFKKKKQQFARNKVKQDVVVSKQEKDVRRRLDSFNLALKNVHQQLKCQSRLNMRDFDIAIKKLRSLNRSRYRKMENKLVNSLAACIKHVGKNFPERAIESRKYALRIFRHNKILLAIKIAPRDPCDLSIAGLGARGKRTLCGDKIRGVGAGPSLVVVPGSRKLKPFAIGKYEVSVAEMNLYCKQSKKCKVNTRVDQDRPVTGIPATTARNYLKWLSKKTVQKYRLPTKGEWLYAATSRRKSLDPNRNCQLSTRGIQKGDELLKTKIGRQNGWGIVNYVGNAREWVYDKGRELVAVGGSYQDAMDQCNLATWAKHDGHADSITGFRVLREIKVH